MTNSPTVEASPNVEHQKPDITIETPSFQQAPLLAGVIDNVRAQQGIHIQHIVIDGKSTDGSLELLRARDTEVTWVSESDGGQAHAINKGFAMAQADIVGWLNCDDRLTPGALALVVGLFALAPDVEFLYGDALAVDLRGRNYGLRNHVKKCDLDSLVRLGDPIVQPAAFWRRDLWKRVGGLREDFEFAFDYEFWMRVAAETTLHYVPVCFAVECLHGDAKTSTGDLGRMAEIGAVARLHGGDGIPRGFIAEAAALEALATMKALIRGKIKAARLHAYTAWSLKPGIWKFGAHALANVVPGSRAVPRLRLIANRMRSRRKPLYPTQLRSRHLPRSAEVTKLSFGGAA